jgi:hypothetical protein
LQVIHGWQSRRLQTQWAVIVTVLLTMLSTSPHALVTWCLREANPMSVSWKYQARMLIVIKIASRRKCARTVRVSRLFF